MGEDIAQELVDWFNQVDATYRGDLKELNELNFARFDVKLEQRTAELRAQINTLDDRMTHLFAQADDRLGKAIAVLRAEIIKWMFLFVVGTALAVIGVMSRLVG